MIGRRWFSSLLLTSMICFSIAARAQSASVAAALDRVERHQTNEWRSLAAHLPDPETATPAALQMAGDVLRARRMPEDALEYYAFALKRGGNEGTLANRVGVTELELHHPEQARAAFRRAIQLNPKDAQAWNNMGATEYVVGSYRAAVYDYLRAVKLNKKAAVFRSNLGTAYFDVKDYESGRKQLEIAVKLDPFVFQGSGYSGIEAKVVSASDRGRFCFEMARLSAQQGDAEGVVRWLAKASETGFETSEEMGKCREFAAYQKDPRVALAIRNARAIRGVKVADVGVVPVLPAPAPAPAP